MLTAAVPFSMYIHICRGRLRTIHSNIGKQTRPKLFSLVAKNKKDQVLMFALHRLRARPLTFLTGRGNSTHATPSSADVLPPPPEPIANPNSTAPIQNAAEETDTTTPQTQGRNSRCKRQRPNISLNSPRKWNRPLALGVVPAYDEALKVIKQDSLLLIAEARDLRETIRKEEAKDVAARDEEGLVNMRKKLGILEVQSQINLPEVRWNFANAMADMSKPVYRYLTEQKWRNEGGLDLLMERIHQMKVVPDVLPDLHPSLDIHMTTLSSLEEYRETKKMYSVVEPGVFLLPHQTKQPPKLYANVFHTDTRLYTLLLVDPDVPDEHNETFTTYLHWMKPNIPLAAVQPSRISDLHTHTRYIPPHPQQGTPYHRYVLLLLPQPSTTKHLEIPVVPDSERLGFDVRAFMGEWGLDGAKGGGAHMWREVWNDQVSKIYSEVLKVEEPRYGRPPKADPYADVKRIKRYV